MASPLDIEDRLAKAVDDRFAETLELIFLKGERADPTRRNVTIKAPLRVGMGGGQVPEGRGQAWATRIAAGKAQVHIRTSSYTGPKIQKGDKIRALDRVKQGQPLFRVTRIDDRGSARIVLEVTEA